MLQLAGSAGLMVHGPEERVDGLRRILQRDVAMAALLVEPAVAGMEPLEPRERRERLRDLAEMALAERVQIQHVAVLRHVRQQRCAASSACAKRRCLMSARMRAHLGLDGRGHCGGQVRRSWHPLPSKKKAGITARPAIYSSGRSRPRSAPRTCSRS